MSVKVLEPYTKFTVHLNSRFKSSIKLIKMMFCQKIAYVGLAKVAFF